MCEGGAEAMYMWQFMLIVAAWCCLIAGTMLAVLATLEWVVKKLWKRLRK